MKINQKGGSRPVMLLLIFLVLVILLVVCLVYKDRLRTLVNNVRSWFVKEEQIFEEEIEKVENLFKHSEVFNVRDNKYTYEDAPLVCTALDSKLATKEQVVDAYKRGANWCNYGWTAGQQALFPVQKDVWKQVREGPKEYRDDCGQHPGVNGGFFENPYLEFGVNCYGKKPEGVVTDEDKISPSMGERNKEMKKKVDKYRQQHMDVLPFNQHAWSEYD